MIKKAFNFYLAASIHVALATLALVVLTYHLGQIPFNTYLLLFVFTGTLWSYNFIKYYPLLICQKKYSTFLSAVIGVSLIALLGAIFCFFKLNSTTQLASLFFGILTALYAVPIAPNKKNLRNLAGVKVYIVSLCWAGVTLLLPLFQAGVEVGTDSILKFIQRFMLTLILILIFEISDLKYDDFRLKTVPQTIGIRATKNVIYILCFLFYSLEFFKQAYYVNQYWITFVLVTILIGFTYYSSEKRSKYYTLFWVEAVPIYWVFLSFLFDI